MRIAPVTRSSQIEKRSKDSSAARLYLVPSLPEQTVIHSLEGNPLRPRKFDSTTEDIDSTAAGGTTFHDHIAEFILVCTLTQKGDGQTRKWRYGKQIFTDQTMSLLTAIGTTIFPFWIEPTGKIDE